MTFRFRDLTLRAKASYVAHAFKSMAKQHHRWMVPILSRYIDPAAVIIDVGGHSGQFAKLLAGIARKGHVFVFEPSSYSCSILRLGLRARMMDSVTVIHGGLGSTTGTETLTTPLKPSGTFRYGLAHMGKHSGDGPVFIEDVPIGTIDTFVADNGLDRLDFIKLDVEGWELRVLEGAAASIDRFRPTMLIELVDGQLALTGDTLEAAWEFLCSRRYRPIGIDGVARFDAPRDGDTLWVPE